MTNCPNCGAPIDITVDKCAYCGTYYEKFPEAEKQKDAYDLCKQIRMGLMTVNEARKLMGLEVLEDPEFIITKPIPMMESD